MHRLAGAAILVAAGLGNPTAVVAQRGPASLDVSVGTSFVGRPYENRGGLAGDVLLAGRLRTGPRGALLGGVAAGFQGGLFRDLDCRLEVGRTTAPCVPLLTGVVALGGWEIAGARGPSARLLAGPGYYRETGARALGGQVRLELATPPLGPVALVGTARGTLLPNLRGQATSFGVVGLGLRLQ